MFGLQHENNLLQALQVELIWIFRRAEYGDDAFSDVGQINPLWFLHDWFRSRGRPTRSGKKKVTENLLGKWEFSLQVIRCLQSICAVSARTPKWGKSPHRYVSSNPVSLTNPQILLRDVILKQSGVKAKNMRNWTKSLVTGAPHWAWDWRKGDDESEKNDAAQKQDCALITHQHKPTKLKHKFWQDKTLELWGYIWLFLFKKITWLECFELYALKVR